MKNYYAPDENGFFGEHGGLYVSETLIPALQELAEAYKAAKEDPLFWEEFRHDLKHYVGRPSPVYHAARLSEHLGGAQIWLKREDLNHTGAHKVNNTIGQALLARRMGKKRVIAETGAGQHGVASATVAARFGMTCDVYMGADDIQRQMPNVFRMKLLGANVVSVDSGSRTLKDAMNEAMREWVARVDDTFYIIGTAAGPAPYPEMVRDFQCVIGNEAKEQMLEAIGRRLNLRMVYDFATTSPIEEIDFINQAADLNMKASERSLEGNYGHCLGKALTRPMGRGIMGDNIFSHILSATSSACDARMAGAPIPVMSNSGSGNQGICATNPVAVFARENHNTRTELVRALMLSHLTAIYIKQHLGTLSALCGCVVAATGSACGITYLMGGDYDKVAAAVKNMIANLTGMICDGAKPSCALKLTSGVSTAVLSAMLAMQGECVTSVEGIIDDCVDCSIRNLAKIGKEAMNETDRCVLEIMTHKRKADA